MKYFYACRFSKGEDKAIHRKLLFAILLLLASLGNLYANGAVVTSNPTNTSLKGVNQQTILVKGQVLDSQVPSVGLPGVSVTIKGTGRGTTTDEDGYFELELSAGAVLVFTSVGYAEQKFTFKQSTNNLKVTLQADLSSLEEVVVVGYGTQKKINLTGAVSQVSGKELENRSVTNMTQALQGVVPNLNIVFGSGKPGQSGSLNIRGNTSINGGNPLVLIDGIPGSIDRVNVNDVASVTVLKDASASAVYGARAAFGVILVTTKQGEKGKPVFSYNTNVGYTTWATNTDFMTSGYWNAKINDEAMYNSLGNTNTRYSEEDYAELWARVDDKTEHPDRPWVVVKPNANGQDMYRYYANFDWHDYLFLDKRPKQEHSISVSGASDKIRYFLSGNFLSEDGMYKPNTDNFGKYNFRVKLDADITDRLTISNNTQFFKSSYQWYGYNDNHRRVTDDVSPSYLYHFMPAYVPFNPDGTMTGYTGVNSYPIGYGFHAALESGKLKGNEDVYEVSSTFGLKYKVAKGLNLHANYTYLQDGSADRYRAVRLSYSKFPGVMEPWSYGQLITDRLSETMNLNHHHVYNVYGNYDVTIGTDHHIQAMAGFNQEERIYKRLFGRGDEFLSETLNDLNLATGELLTTGGASEWTLRGAFYRFNYDYKGKYLFETSGRYDGTSRFGKSDRFGFFPSFSAGWLISEEPFYERLKAVNNSLKLRFSYGELGNQNVGTYAYISSMSTGRINYLVNGQNLNVMNNPAPVAPSLTWERSRTSNLGLDAEFMKGRLSFSLDVYKRETKGMLTLGKTLPKVFGAAEPRENAADLETKGFDLALGWRDSFDLGGKSFSYHIQGVLSDYTAYITRFDNPNNLLSNYYKGQKLGDIWGYHYDGFFKTTDEAQEYAATVNQDNINVRRRQAPTTELRMLQAGDIKILDLDGNGVISVGENTLEKPGDRRIIGNSQPRYSYGLTLGGSWNNIDLSVFLQGIGKQNWYPHFEAQQFWHVYARPYGSFLPANFQDMMWSEDNPDAYFPLSRGYAAQNAELRQANNMYLQDVGYLKLRNLTVGYTLPKVVTDRVKLNKMRVYFSGENLHTWAKLDTDYIDPEEVMTDPTGRTYPMGRVFSAGLQLMF